MQIEINAFIEDIHIEIASQIDVRKVDIVDAIARAVCSANCEARGLLPCWSFHTDRADAMEWPNPFCDKPGCHAVANSVFVEIEGDLSDD